MRKGFWIILLGTLCFAGSLTFAQSLGLSGLTAGLVAGAAVVTAALCLVVGNILIASEKGYPVGTSLLLGLLGPIGLVIVLIMPTRRSRF